MNDYRWQGVLRHNHETSLESVQSEQGSSGVTKWQSQPANGWRIGQGSSNFLVAEGSGHSRAIGMVLFRALSAKNIRKQNRGKRIK